MPQDLDKEYADIKAGVEGAIGDIPAPSEAEAGEVSTSEALPEEQPSIPETSYADGETAVAPSYGYGEATEYGGQQAIDSSRLQQIVESIVSEKIADAIGNLGDLTAWKEKINHDVVSIKQELLRVEERFENLQNAILGKVKDYDEGIRSVHTEMKALEKVFERILEPLVTNVKELSRITAELKKAKR